MNVQKSESNRYLVLMFVSGVVLVCGVLLTFHQMGLLWEFSLIFSTQFLSGREFAMLHGASKDISPTVMILVSFISDVGSMLIGLPIFIIFYEELKTVPLLSPFMNFSETIISNKSGVIHKFGLLGLFIICFIPLQMTGSLATSCFAKLLGYTVREILPVVSIASLSASVFWALTADTVMNYLGAVQYYIPFFIVLGVIFIVIYNFTHYRKK